MDIAVHKNWESHIDASHSRQPLVKGERLVRYEVNAVIAQPGRRNISEKRPTRMAVLFVFWGMLSCSQKAAEDELNAMPVCACVRGQLCVDMCAWSSAVVRKIESSGAFRKCVNACNACV